MAQNAKAVSDNEFSAQVLGNSKVSVVDFWAEWCGPCRVLAPVIDSIAGELGEKVDVFKMDVDANTETPSRYKIRGIPTVIIFKNGQPVDQLVGNQPREVIVQAIERQIQG